MSDTPKAPSFPDPPKIDAPLPKPPSAFGPVVLAMLAMAAGFLGNEWKNRMQAPAQAGFEQMISPENALRVPREVDMVVGKPTELRADTRGTKVMWMPLEKEIEMVPIDMKAAWVYAMKSGDYRVVSWTSINNLPTPNQLTVLHVKEPEK